MPDEVTLEITQLTENVTVETVTGDVVEIKVVAPSGEDGTSATVTVGTTTTGAAGTNASVTNSGTTSAAVFNFTIPRGATGPAGPNSVTSATTSDGTADLDVATITGDGSGLTGLVSAQITDASTAPVYNESTELFDEVAALYNENGELNAAGFVTEGGSFYSFYGDDFVSISFAQSPLNFKIGTKQFRFNQPAGNGGQYNMPDGTGTLALTSSASGGIVSADITDATITGEANKVVKINSGGNLVCNVLFANTSIDVGEEGGQDGYIQIINASGNAARIMNQYDSDGVILTIPTVSSGTYPIVVTNDLLGRADKVHDGTISGVTTINSTSYTYGTGAALAHGTAMGFYDSRIASCFTSPYLSVADHFLGRFAGGNGNGFLNWLTVGSNLLWSDTSFIYSGFLGGTVIYNNNNACFNYVVVTPAASIANYNNVVFDFVFNTSSPNTSENIFVGIRSTASSTVETGRKGLWYEAGVDTNWQLLHETSAGVRTKIDTGKAVAANQTVRVTMKFVSDTQTDLIIATSTNTTPVTVSATSGFSCTGSLGLGFGLRSTTAANRFLIPMRAVLAWQPPTL